MSDNKTKKLCIIALLLAFMSIGISESITTSFANNTLGLQIVVNNTDMGITGTNERVSGVTYHNNNSDIEIFLFAHANSTGQNANINLTINGTKVAESSGKPLGIAEENNKSIIAIIPRYSAYSATFSNYHHYEWREYQVLSGNISSNVTAIQDRLSGYDVFVNATHTIQMYVGNTSLLLNGGLTFTDGNHSFGTNNLYGFFMGGLHNQTQTNMMCYNSTTGQMSYSASCGTDNDSAYVNKSGDNLTGNLSFGNVSIINNSIRMVSDGVAHIDQTVINETGTPAGSASFVGYVIWARFTPNATYSVSQLATNFASATAASFRMALYTSNGTLPVNLINESSSTTAIAGWNTIAIPATILTGGTEYWVAVQSTGTTNNYYSTGGSQAQRGGGAFPYGAFPNPSGAVSYGNTMNDRIYSQTVFPAYSVYCIHVVADGTLYTTPCS